MTSSSKTNSPNYKRKTARISVKSPTYINLESSNEEHQHKRTPSPPPRNKSLSPPHAPLKSTSSRSTYQTTSSSPNNWPPGPSNPSAPPRVSHPPPGFEHLPPPQPFGPHDTQYCMEDLKQAFVEYASSSTNEIESRPFTRNQGPRSFNEVVDGWKEKPNFNLAYAQTFIYPQNGLLSTYSSNYQTKLEKALVNFDSHQEKRLSSLKSQLGQQQDDMISKVNILWKTVSKKFDDTPLCDTAGGLIAQMNFTSTDYHTKEEL
ncbi:hypothetical protein Tco_0568709 [Tanacetum coccineum]